MPSNRIKFRGASYQPYILGTGKSHDSVQWRGRRKPRFKEISVNEDSARTCYRCQNQIAVEGRYYATRGGGSIHEIC